VLSSYVRDHAALVGRRSPTSTRKSGRLGDITIPGFVPLQEFCSPIRLQHLSVQCKQTLKCCNLIGQQNSCSGTNPGIVMSPNFPLYRMEVGLLPTNAALQRMPANADFSTRLKCLASGKKPIEQLRPSAPRQSSALELLVVYCFRILLVYPCALYYGMLNLSRAHGACPTPLQYCSNLYELVTSETSESHHLIIHKTSIASSLTMNSSKDDPTACGARLVPRLLNP